MWVIPALCLRRWEERDLPAHSWTKFIDAKRKELQRLNNAYKNTLSNAKVELLQGFGKIVDPHTVDVDGKKYTVGGHCWRLVGVCTCWGAVLPGCKMWVPATGASPFTRIIA